MIIIIIIVIVEHFFEETKIFEKTNHILNEFICPYMFITTRDISVLTYINVTMILCSLYQGFK